MTEEAFDGEHYVAHNKFYEQVTNISVGEEAICKKCVISQIFQKIKFLKRD